MNNSNTHDQRIAKMTFSSVYPLYLVKVEKKGRTKEELDRVITWLTGFNNEQLKDLIGQKATFEKFFQMASLFVAFLQASLSCLSVPDGDGGESAS